MEKQDKKQRANRDSVKWQLAYFYNILVLEQTVILLLSFSAKNPTLCQAVVVNQHFKN
jgi:hypothetical protein